MTTIPEKTNLLEGLKTQSAVLEKIGVKTAIIAPDMSIIQLSPALQMIFLGTEQKNCHKLFAPDPSPRSCCFSNFQICIIKDTPWNLHFSCKMKMDWEVRIYFSKTTFLWSFSSISDNRPLSVHFRASFTMEHITICYNTQHLLTSLSYNIMFFNSSLSKFNMWQWILHHVFKDLGF